MRAAMRQTGGCPRMAYSMNPFGKWRTISGLIMTSPSANTAIAMAYSTKLFGFIISDIASTTIANAMLLSENMGTGV